VEFYKRRKGKVWHIIRHSQQLRCNMRTLRSYCNDMSYNPPTVVCTQDVVEAGNLPVCRRCQRAYERR